VDLGLRSGSGAFEKVEVTVFVLEKMSYDPESCTVIYRSRMHKIPKRNFQIMHGADWLAQLCTHIPDRIEHLVRYAGWYSNRSRGKRTRMKAQPTEVTTG
jgi:hypothetical protein